MDKSGGTNIDIIDKIVTALNPNVLYLNANMLERICEKVFLQVKK